jgi:hypothetical protein
LLLVTQFNPRVAQEALALPDAPFAFKQNANAPD